MQTESARALATEAARALTSVAFGIPGVRRLEMHIDPANTPSIAVARKLNYGKRETLGAEGSSPEREPPATLVFELTAEDYAPAFTVKESNVT